MGQERWITQHTVGSQSHCLSGRCILPVTSGKENPGVLTMPLLPEAPPATLLQITGLSHAALSGCHAPPQMQLHFGGG